MEPKVRPPYIKYEQWLPLVVITEYKWDIYIIPN